MNTYDSDDDYTPPRLIPPPPLVAGPSSSSASSYMPLGPAGATGAVPTTPARAPLGGIAPFSGASAFGVEVLACKLVDAKYTGRRVRFATVTGTLRGVVQTMGLALRLDGGTTARAGAQKLHLIDDRGQDHYLEFTATDRARVLD